MIDEAMSSEDCKAPKPTSTATLSSSSSLPKIRTDAAGMTSLLVTCDESVFNAPPSISSSGTFSNSLKPVLKSKGTGGEGAAAAAVDVVLVVVGAEKDAIASNNTTAATTNPQPATTQSSPPPSNHHHQPLSSSSSGPTATASAHQSQQKPSGFKGFSSNAAAAEKSSNNNNNKMEHSADECVEFIRPPECPVFRPNEEEFKNPLQYISKIRPLAEKFGIAKILPPRTWTPPFTVDVDKLKFTPRVQRLNELEAKTRVKLNFLDQIAKFWELQGSSLKIPMVERKALDLYSLHRIVTEEGGLEQTTRERKWSKIAQRLHYPTGKSIGAILKAHYERILHPFDIHIAGKGGGGVKVAAIITDDDDDNIKLETDTDDKDYQPHGIVLRQQITPPNEATARRSKRFANSNASKESACGLGRGAGGGGVKMQQIKTDPDVQEKEKMTTYRRSLMPKSAIVTVGAGVVGAVGAALSVNSGTRQRNIRVSRAITPKKLSSSSSIGTVVGATAGVGAKTGVGATAGVSATPGVGLTTLPPPLPASLISSTTKLYDPLSRYICPICNRGDVEEAMLLCDGCDDSYHTFCLLPPLQEIPKGEWRCPRCVVEEVSKPNEAFGFEQAQREYTLQQFGEMADQFKADYFRRPVHMVPTEMVEREFWRIVSSIDEDVTVEYGADLHTMDHGSGFPTKSSLYLLTGDQEYAESNWNLNNLPLLEESILGYINADISGMKVPWMYVGMCFAAFCWHNEDHWSYSINYLHWGEPKTWYGVPGSQAELFERTMMRAAPELFRTQPDLLHQLVTIMNPNILMNNGVSVYRTDQHAGEFVITFPRAYHAGFNQGYNFAEAVNFAPADWLKMGRECINHYSTLHRFCVFSHDELVCKMALEPDKLSFGIATACYVDMVQMVDTEKKMRKSLLEWGVTKAEREAFELIPDDERQCEVCKTTCFLSAVSCQCTKSIACLRHYTELCRCPADRHTLQYRYTLDEMPHMLRKLQAKAQSFENWLGKCRDVIDPNTATTITLEALQEICKEAEEKKFPNSLLIDRLNAAVQEAEKCVAVIQQLDINKVRTRTRHSNDSAKYKLTMEELDMFVQEIDSLCCTIREGQSVRELFTLGKSFVCSAEIVLARKLNKIDEKTLEKLIDEGSSLCIELPQLTCLRLRREQLSWYNRARRFRSSSVKFSLADLNKYIKEGMMVTPHMLIERELSELQSIVCSIECWENAARNCFDVMKTQHELPEIEFILEAADSIQGEVPSRAALKEAVKRVKDWLQAVDALQASEHYPYFHTLEGVVQRGRTIPFKLEQLDLMSKHLEAGCDWKEKTGKVFLRQHCARKLSLLEVLSPRRYDVLLFSAGALNKKEPPPLPHQQQQSHQLSQHQQQVPCLPLLEEQFNESLSPAQMVDAFKKAEDREIRDIKELRKLNVNKSPIMDKYCTCKGRFFGKMYLCQLCLDWFHEDCVQQFEARERQEDLFRAITSPSPLGSPTATTTSITSSTSSVPSTTAAVVALVQQQQPILVVPQFPSGRGKDRETKYLCIGCRRSRRPRLETILGLLVSLQRLPLRLPEGEALQCLTERAMNWQDRVRHTFATDEVANALTTLSAISQRRNVTVAPSSRITFNKQNRAAGNGQRQRQLKQQIRQRQRRQRQQPPKQRRPMVNPAATSDQLDTSTDHSFESYLDDDRDDDDDNDHKNKIKSNYNDDVCGSSYALQNSTERYNNSLKDTSSDEDFFRLRIDEDAGCYSSPGASISSTESPRMMRMPLTSSSAKIEHAYSAPTMSPIIVKATVSSATAAHNRNFEMPFGKSSNFGGSVPFEAPLIKLKRSTREILEDLMMEGDLLEVTLDETTHLWRILNAAKPSITDLAQIQCQYDIPVNSSDVKGHKEVVLSGVGGGNNITSSTNVSAVAAPQSITQSLSRATVAVPTKRDGNDIIIEIPGSKRLWKGKVEKEFGKQTKRRTPVAAKKRADNKKRPKLISVGAIAGSGSVVADNKKSSAAKSNCGGPRSMASSNQTIHKRKRMTKIPTLIQVGEKRQLVSAINSTSDDDEECSATNCHKPSGREVDWVQCDGGCNEWFHMFCVGLDREQIKMDDDYICKRCMKAALARSSNQKVPPAHAPIKNIANKSS